MARVTVANPVVERSAAFSSVVTPQAVLLEFPTAGIGTRVLAKAIDLAIQLLLLIGVSVGAALAGGGSASFIVGAVGVFVVVFGYPCVEAVLGGQTIGKKALSIRVITTDGGPCRFRHAAVRSLIGFVELFVLPPGGPLALGSALFTRRSQRVGDLVAETIVVRDKGKRAEPQFFWAPPGLGPTMAGLDLAALGNDEYTVLRDFVMRADDFDATVRSELGRRLCDALGRLGIDKPPGIDPDVFVRAVVAAHQQRFAPAAADLPPPVVGASPPPPNRSGAGAGMPPPTGPAVDMPTHGAGRARSTIRSEGWRRVR